MHEKNYRKKTFAKNHHKISVIRYPSFYSPSLTKEILRRKKKKTVVSLHKFRSTTFIIFNKRLQKNNNKKKQFIAWIITLYIPYRPQYYISHSLQFSDMKHPLITESGCDSIVAEIIYVSSHLLIYPWQKFIPFLIPWGNAYSRIIESQNH